MFKIPAFCRLHLAIWFILHDITIDNEITIIFWQYNLNFQEV